MGVVLNNESLVAFCRLLATLILGAATTFGWALDATLVFNILVSIGAVVMFVYTWWKNNNITKAAQEAQKVLNGIKREDEDAEAITELVEEEVTGLHAKEESVG